MVISPAPNPEMSDMHFVTDRARTWGLTLTFALGLSFGLAGCHENPATGVGGSVRAEVGVVLNSVELSLTVFPVDSPSAGRTIGLGPAGSPVTLALRDSLAAVPMGQVPAVAIANLKSGDVRTVPLPDSSGATGVAFIDDSTVYVANPNRNSVSVVNVRSGTLGPEIPAGLYPQFVVAARGRVFVLDGELVDFVPARNGRITVIDPASRTVADSFSLGGRNPQKAKIGPDGLLYVIDSGDFGMSNGSLSVVNPSQIIEVRNDEGFGDFPGDLAFDAAGRVYITSFDYGVAVWDPGRFEFVHAPGDPLVVQGQSSASGIGTDSEDRLYILVPGPDPQDPSTSCTVPSVALRLNPDDSFDRQIPVGICPIAIDFTRIRP